MQKKPQNSVVLSFDEKGRTPVKQFGGIKWTKDNYYRIPYNQKVKGLFDIFMAVNVHTKQRHFRFYMWKNSFIVIDYFEWLLSEIYPEEDVYIILDMWSAHKSYAVKVFADLHPRLNLVYLPTCSSWMNPVERDFSRIQREVLDNSNFESTSDARRMVYLFIEKELNSN